MTDLPDSQYRDKDDGLHPFTEENYYEWWYFDTQFDNGYSCVINYHYRLAFQVPHVPAIQLNIYTPEGKMHVGFRTFDKSDISASEDHCDVKMGEHFVRQENSSYRLKFRTRRTGTELVFKNLQPGWKPLGTGILLSKDTAVQGWVVPVPRAEVEGTLFIGETAIPVKGKRGYHDHNWGNSNMYDNFSGWYWGRMYDDKYTVIYGWVYPVNKKDQIAARLHLARDNKPLLGTSNFRLSEKNVRTDPQLRRKYAGNLVLTSKENDIDFKCRLNTRSVVEKIDLSPFASWPTYYFRFLADYTAEIKSPEFSDRVSGETLHEYMLFK